MQRLPLKFLLSATAIILLISCDPFYSITITNTTDKVATVLIKENKNFNTEKLKISTTRDGFDVYNLNPNEQADFGSAIAEIDNDIPFEEIKIIKNGDTISATNSTDIKKLFDINYFGNLEKPYNISIK